MSSFEFALAGAANSVAYAFPSPRFIIGSEPSVGLRFDASLVQGQHAEVAIDSKGVPWIRDLTNQAQLWVNGAQTDRAALALGATVRIGKLELQVRQRAPADSAVGATAQRPTPFGVPPVSVRQSGPNQALNLESTAKRPSPFATPALDSTAKRPTPFRNMPVGGKVSGAQWKPVLTPQPTSNLEMGDEATRPRAAQPVSPTLEVNQVSGERTVLPEGAIIGGRYRIIKKLAAGGMGEVYQAEHVELHKQFAVKVMLPALSSDPDFVNRFKREAISASRIGQLNIIDISDFGQTAEDGRFYFVMEFLDGVTIASLLHRQGPMPLLRMVNIAVQVARALAAAHAQGIVHRDMKPENIMVLQRPGQPDFVKVLDFGVAKVSKGPGEGGQTQLGMVVGTPQYMSPEQAMGVAVDSRTDTYALGLIFYEMLTGTATFQGDTASILMVKQVTEPAPPFPDSVAATMPAALNELIFEMLEKDPKLRPVNMDRIVSTLEDLQAHLRVGAQLPLATASGRFPSTATPQQLSPVRVTASGLPVASAPRPSGSSPAVTPSGRVAQLPQMTPSGQTAALPLTGEQMALAAPTSKTPLIVGALAVIAIIIAGAAIALRPDAEKPKEPVVAATPPPVPTLPPVEKVDPAPAVKSFKVALDSVPTGAQVLRGAAILGTTRMELTLEKGEELTVDLSLPGYVKEQVTLAPISDAPVTITLKKLGGPKGSSKPTDPGPKPAGGKDNGLIPDPYGGQVPDLQDDPYK